MPHRVDTTQSITPASSQEVVRVVETFQGQLHPIPIGKLVTVMAGRLNLQDVDVQCRGLSISHVH